MMLDVKTLEKKAAAKLAEFSFIQKTIDLKPAELAKSIDHTLLSPDAKESDIAKICNEANKYNFAAVCIAPNFVEYAANKLNKNVNLCTVIGFPLGYNQTKTKINELQLLESQGATELDFVLAVNQVKSQNWQYINNEFAAIRQASAKCLKLILECCLLTDLEKVIVSLLAIENNIDFLKTSTGFSKAGATNYDVALLKFIAQDKAKIKASGGIKEFSFAKELMANGANRIGASSSLKLIAAEN